MNPIGPFLTSVQRRLNRHHAYNVMLVGAGVGAAVLLGIAATYLMRGEAVPGVWYPAAVAVTFLGMLVAILSRCCSVARATQFADEYFHLEDSVTSSRRFSMEKKEGGFYDLQQQRTVEQLNAVDASRIRYPFPKKLAVVSGMLMLAAASTAFIPPSPEVVARQNLERETMEKSAALNEGIQDFVQELEKELTDPLEKELLESQQLKDLVDDLRATKDLKQAMRQYAALERKLSQAANRLDQRRDERLLAKAGEELQKEAQHRALGERLKSQKYKDAAKRLQAMKLRQKKDEKDLKKQRERLKKLKSAAKRMASAARNSRSQGKNSQVGDGENADLLSELMERLSENADMLDQELNEMEQQGQLGQLGNMSREQLQKLLDQMDQMDLDLDGLGNKLNRLEAKRKLQGKLRMFGMKLSKAQGFCAGQCDSPFAMPGGKKPGTGTIESRRNERDELVENGNYSQLKGLKGAGPSQTQVQTANEGTGVARRVAEDTEHAFTKQMEQFVQREDVPADVKDGVREYFTTIHQVSEENPNNSETPTTQDAP